MKVPIDFRPQTRYVLACIRRGNRDTIDYNSGLIYFSSRELAEEFKGIIQEGNPQLEIFSVDVRTAHTPGEERGKGYWCPYCQSWEYWVTDSGGYKRCPICGMSDRGYYVRMYNNLWASEMKSKSAKKKLDRARK